MRRSRVIGTVPYLSGTPSPFSDGRPGRVPRNPVLAVLLERDGSVEAVRAAHDFPASRLLRGTTTRKGRDPLTWADVVDTSRFSQNEP